MKPERCQTNLKQILRWANLKEIDEVGTYPMNVNMMMMNKGKHSIASHPDNLACTRLKCSISLDSSACIKHSKPTFSYRELAAATNNFRTECLIGKGGFGSVYIGNIGPNRQVVAVKKLDTTGVQGSTEFLVEVLMLSLLHHPNLVDLVGFCAEGDQRLLVYEFLPLGSLEYHLHDHPPEVRPLEWNTRMKIAAGIAQGLDYLHNQADPPVIHRDLKSSNVLLDEGFHPKLSDFGLARFGSHVSTRVMGTEGYCAPEYFDTGKLTANSDTYSFGILLLEIISGHRAKDTSRKEGLLEWARPLLGDPGKSVEIVDERLEGELSKSGLQLALDVAVRCLEERPRARPSMGDVSMAMKVVTSQQFRCEMKETRDEGGVPAASGGDGVGRDEEREREVAEARLWGERWRDKMQRSTMKNSNSR